ncbi:MAG: 2-oxoglutarate dehydrogenase E1 component [Alphaproteobacteria bacterium]
MTLSSLDVVSAANAAYLSDLYGQYEQNPASVDPSWGSFFAALKQGLDSDDIPQPANMNMAIGEAVDEGSLKRNIQDSIRALALIRAYRVRGHLHASLDPLNLEKKKEHPELDPYTYGFGPEDDDRLIWVEGFGDKNQITLKELLASLKATYCGPLGVEFNHIQDPEQRNWILERIEKGLNQTEFTTKGKIAILERLTTADMFEKFLQIKYTGTKRFGLEGGEALVPGIEQVMKRGAQLGLKEIVLGMAHRGRLNVLANVMGKPFAAIFSEFQGMAAHPDDVQGSGDVKYHLGTSSDRDFDGNIVHLSLTANPSHLEAVNPVVVGKVRAKQEQRGDDSRTEVLGLLIHGDAAFAGQGLVPETLALSELKGYRTGGTVHFIINNQIGFTTNPANSRSGPYCTDVAKLLSAPIFHVNGDDAEAVIHVCRIATEFRQEFKKDVVIDMFCYRRHGHNESDEPAFTQPLMYKAIKQHPTTCEIYANRLIAENVLTQEGVDAINKECRAKLDKAFDAASSYKANKADWLEGKWAGLESARKAENIRGNTGVAESQLKKITKALVTVPEGFNLNSKIARQLEQKQQMVNSGTGIDWAMAEALAFGSLLLEGVPVRLSGQDCGRGTFSHRHAVWHDQENEKRYVALNHIEQGQANFEVIDSPLSEAAVLGFDYGYSLAEPHSLVLWEGQFGDFVNGAQVIIDQFISSAESKWLRMSGLVMLLPHGYEGQGPEHSSARLERFLQLCAEDNLQVANCTTPANYYHILRRQVKRTFRKPLIIMTPKSLLRHKLAVSDLAEFTSEKTFHRVLPETDKAIKANKVKRVVVCSGKVYYDLVAARDAAKIDHVAILRLEQLYPFPSEALAVELKKYPKADLVWCQEEPINMGGWFFVDRRLEAMLASIDHAAKRPIYAGRAEAASPATGSLKRHNQEQEKLVNEALSV